MAHDVFISYSSKDKLVADAVCASLEAAKIRCWITPRDILPGQDWAESIEGAITKCKILVLIFSSYSNNSKQIAREISLAFNSEVTVIPFRIEDIEPKGAMKYYLLNTHWQDALTPPMENHIKKLIEIVSTFIGKKIDDTKEVDKIISDQSKELTEQQLREYEKPEHVPGKVLTGKGKKPKGLEIKKWFIKKQNKKKLAIIFGVIGVIIIAAAITLFIKFPINKTDKVVETAAVAESVVAETTAIETSVAETAAVVETTSLQNKSDQSTFSKIAFTSNRDGLTEIYIMNVDGSEQTRLTNNDAFDGAPSFSPDGSKIAFASNRDGNYEIYIMNADGSEQIRLTNNDAFDGEPSFSPIPKTTSESAAEKGEYGLGDTGPAGGLIFYINPNYETDGWKYLEASPVDLGGIQWHTGSYMETDATATAVGTGKANTQTIINIQGEGIYAAQLCNDLTQGGYSDWFLPSKGELDLMYKNLKKAGLGGFPIGNPSNISNEEALLWQYWSSSEYDLKFAWFSDFTNGIQYINHDKNFPFRVRAVRAF